MVEADRAQMPNPDGLSDRIHRVVQIPLEEGRSLYSISFLRISPSGDVIEEIRHSTPGMMTYSYVLSLADAPVHQRPHFRLVVSPFIAGIADPSPREAESESVMARREEEMRATVVREGLIYVGSSRVAELDSRSIAPNDEIFRGALRHAFPRPNEAVLAEAKK
jgi:hypothetical protein